MKKIWELPSTSSTLSRQQNNDICGGDENDPTPTALTSLSLSLSLGEGEHYYYIRGSNPDNDHDPDDDDDDGALLQCVICLYDVVKGDKYRVLGDCKHGFHVHCIGAWLENNSTCPLCRCPVPYTRNNSCIRDEAFAFHDAILSCFLAFLDHLYTWFLNPLGFDDPAAYVI